MKASGLFSIPKSILINLGFVEAIWWLDDLYKVGAISNIEHKQWKDWVLDRVPRD